MSSQTFYSVPQLPACRICHDRKVKCDSGRPKCRNCITSGNECVNFDQTTRSWISREYIHQLETKELEILGTSSTTQHWGAEGSDVSNSQGYMLGDGGSTRVPGTGLSFMKSLFTDERWRQYHAENMNRNIEDCVTQGTVTTPHELPPISQASQLVTTYLETSQLQHPFLLQQDIQDTFRRIYDHPDTTHDDQDLFRLFMIFAIGSVPSMRRRTHDKDPFGYYLAAMQHWNAVFTLQGLQAAQNLLLISRFGIYSRIGTSIWDLVQMCMRVCIELELHLRREPQKDFLQEQLERRVFWCCYVSDRYSSITLDRPVAIADRDITTPLPVNANDDEVSAASILFPDLDSYAASQSTVGLNDMSIFVHFIDLRRITSKIHAKVSRSTSTESKEHTFDALLLTTGQINIDIRDLSNDLEQWRQSAPFFENPKCLYQRQTFYDMLVSRERLLLVRKALDLVPKRNDLPPRNLLKLCLKLAIELIQAFSIPFRENQVSATRSYFQTTFTAGCSILFCISAPGVEAEVDIQDPWHALSLCDELLTNMGDSLPDAKPYVRVFKALSLNVTKRIRGSSKANTPQPESHSTPTVNQSDLDRLLSTHSFFYPTYSQYGANPSAMSGTADPWSYRVDQSFGTDPSLIDPNLEPIAGASSTNTLFLNENLLWQMEAGLGDYAYGDGTYPDPFSGFDFNF